MNLINQFDKSNLVDLRKDIDLALAEVGKKYGIKINAGSARFTGDTATFKLEMSIFRDGKAICREMETLKLYLGLIGLSEEHFGVVFKIGGKYFVLSGYNPRKHKKPVMITEVGTEVVYFCSEDSVRNALGVAPKPQYGEI